MKNNIFLLLLCCFIVACTNEKTTQAADDSETIRTDTVLTDETHDELLEQVQDTVDAQVQDTDVVAQAFQNNIVEGTYRVTKIETYLVPNENEKLRTVTNTNDSISIDGKDAIAVITRNEPFSVDTIRITRKDLAPVIQVRDITRREICWINLKEIKTDTLVFSVIIQIPDTDDGYIIDCYHYDNKNIFEIDDYLWPDDEE